MIKTPRQLKLESALVDARHAAQSTGKAIYVQWIEIKQDYGLTYRAPMFGEWYTSEDRKSVV